MPTSTLKRFPHLAGIGLIGVLACVLYLPFLGNPLVFDDWVFFSGSRFSYYATHPFDFFNTRNLPYFSLAFTYIVGGGIQWHRVVSLALHLACSLALYKLLYDLLRLTPHSNRASSAAEAQRDAALWALIGAAVFAIHPVAVYGAGYLVQRTIVLATLFSLLSIVLFVRGLKRHSHADAISAALMYTLAVYSKEHSVLLPAAAVLAALLVVSDRRFAYRHSAIYLSACAPAAIFIVLLSRRVIGDAYEPDFGMVAAQLEGVFGLDISDMPWSLSAVSQAGLFFKYAALWLWPDTSGMSVDLRLNFIEDWSPGWIFLKVSAFAIYGLVGAMLLWRRGRAGLAGFGLLYTGILFLVEFSAARFQEPFVLYRSYLWAPGMVITFIALSSHVPRRAALVIFAIMCPVLLYQANNRLVTFSSPFLLWEDAVAKLPDKPVPWGSRTLYNLGREYMYGRQPDKAVEIVERCMAQYPDSYHCYFARGAIFYEQGKFKQALPYFTRAVILKPASGIAHYRLGILLENLGRVEDAKTHFRRAAEIGFMGANFDNKLLESSGGGLLPPEITAPASR
ncbi:MAG: tetratricopeptide repeat protein [Burkholderiales bacterium]|nr:tetratricopeptide repeat protein [Burkholderiales bacterium]